MKQLVIFPTGSLSAKDKERMSKEGFLAIEAEDPTRVIIAIPSCSLVTADDVTLSALQSLLDSPNISQEHSKFTRALCQRVLGRKQP